MKPPVLPLRTVQTVVFLFVQGTIRRAMARLKARLAEYRSVNFCLIGIDVGTTSTKATLIDSTGRELSNFSRTHPTRRDMAGMAEQNPADWFDSILAALDQFAQVVEPSRVIGIGLTSQVNSHVFVGESGNALRPAITWQDTRAAPDAARIDGWVTAEQKTNWFGGPMPIDSSHALSRIAYVARTEGSVWGATRHVLLPKDFIALSLTGSVASDPVAAVGLVDSAGRYIDELLDLVPGSRDRLPPLFPFQHTSGHVRPGLPFAGIPVMVGAMDAWAGMFGCGVVRDGEAMYQSGTSEIPGIVSSTVVPTPGVILFPPYEGIRMHAAPTQSGGAALVWLSNLLGRSPEELSALAAQCAPTDNVPLFLPHLAGERAPIWDVASRGTFARMDSNTGPAQLTRSVMEGVAFSVRWAFEALSGSAGQTIRSANIGGGGSRSDVWCQIRADVLGMTLRRTAVPDAAALGAAILAGVGANAFSALPQAVGQLVRIDREFEPNASLTQLYTDRFDHFRALYGAMKPFNDRF
jgi:xylulokinase